MFSINQDLPNCPNNQPQLLSMKDVAYFFTTQGALNRNEVKEISDSSLKSPKIGSVLIIIQSQKSDSLQLEVSDPLLVDPTLVTELLNETLFDAQKKSRFNVEIQKHPFEFKILGYIIELPTGNVIRGLDTNTKQTYCLRFYDDIDLKQFKAEFSVLQYISSSVEALNPSLNLHAYFQKNPKTLFVNFAGFGRETVFIKENWLSRFFSNPERSSEKMAFWSVYEAGLYDMGTLLKTIKREKVKIPLPICWILLLRLSEILLCLKKLCVAHLGIRPEHLFIPAGSQMTWKFDENAKECSQVFKRLSYLKLGGFSWARVINGEKNYIELSRDLDLTSEYQAKDSENGKLVNPYKSDIYAVGIIMTKVLAEMNEKFDYHIVDKNDKRNALVEKTKGLLKGLVYKMTEPKYSRIEIEQLWEMVCEHTNTLLKEDPLWFENEKEVRNASDNTSIKASVPQNEQEEAPVAIFHAFNMAYSQIDDKLMKFIKEIGFSHIQISPTQKSSEYGAWHDKYQPLDYIPQNRYGDAEDLIRLTERAHSYGIKIIADVVFNHMGSITWWDHINRNKYEHKKAEYYSYRRKLVERYGQIFQQKGSRSNPDHYFTEWNEDGWLGGSLPQLNTMHPDVKRVQIQYLKYLTNLGIDGFRFDAIKTIDKQSLRDYVAAVGDKWLYGEFVSGEVHQNHQFTPIMPITDFVFVNYLIGIFSISGSLRNTRLPVTNLDPRSVTFAVNHDTWAAKNSRGRVGINMTFGDDKDAELATLFVLARHDGVPLIMTFDLEKPSIQAGTAFRRVMRNRKAPMETVHDSIQIFEGCNLDTFLLMQRGTEGIFMLNKCGGDIKVPRANISAYSCPVGYYVNPEDGSWWRVYEERNTKYLVNQDGIFYVPKRSGIFLIRIDHLD